MEKQQRHLIFVCVSNRGRSVFAELFFRKIIGGMDKDLCDRIKVTSAGFIPQAIRDQVTQLRIGFPEPFYDRPMADATRAYLSKKGIVAPPDWRSRELTSEMIEDADLIVTAIPQQKDDLVALYPAATAKISTIREISQWEGPFRFEDLARLPKDESYWTYVEEDADFVGTILLEVERSLMQALPNILSRLGCGGRIRI